MEKYCPLKPGKADFFERNIRIKSGWDILDDWVLKEFVPKNEYHHPDVSIIQARPNFPIFYSPFICNFQDLGNF